MKDVQEGVMEKIHPMVKLKTIMQLTILRRGEIIKGHK